MSRIPKDWRRTELGSIGRVIRGSSPRPKGDPRYYGGTIPRLMGADVSRDGKYVTPRIDFLTEEGAKLSRPVLAGTLTVICSGDIGVPAILAVDACIHDGFLALLDIDKSVDKEFLYQALLPLKQAFHRSATHGGVFINLTTEIFGEFPVNIPPLDEQRAISRFLGRWDDSLFKFESLLAAKLEHKRGLMQQLLTGQTRFKEFKSEQWCTHRLGELFTERVETGRIDLPLVAITGQNGVVPRDSLTKRDSSSEDKSKYLRITPGDIGYNTMRMWQGVAGLSQIEGIVSPAYTILSPSKQIDGQFAAYLFKTAPIIHTFHRNSQGLVDDTLSLKYHNFARIHVTIPSVPEQKRIAAVLNTCDAEIKLMEKQLEALKEQKRGLMQKLLTGEIRVKVLKEN